MRKNKLIELLQAIPGNPQVVGWNGIVGDYMGLAKPVEYDLVRMKEAKILELIALQAKRDGREPEVITHEQFVKTVRPNYGWEVPNQWIAHFHQEHTYESRRVVLLDFKARGKIDYGRGGNISY